jgi:hypothetical protein
MPSRATGATSPEHPQVLLSKKQAAAALAMSVSHFERHVQGSLPYVRIGQLTLYPSRELELWADSHAALPRAPSALVGGPTRQSSHDGKRRAPTNALAGHRLWSATRSAAPPTRASAAAADPAT